jgi:hypothetical protein
LEERRNLINRYYPAKRIHQGPVYCFAHNPCFFQETTDKETIERLAGHSGKRLLMIGTSQTIGAGASTLEDTFFSQLHHGLMDQSNLVSLNISISGVDADRMLEEFKNNLDVFKPHVVLVNLGLNYSRTDLEMRLKDFIKLAESRHLKIIMIREAINGLNNGLDPYLQTVEKVAREEKVSLVDLHSHIQKIQRAEIGELWWDIAHLTDLGQKEAGAFLLREIERIGF